MAGSPYDVDPDAETQYGFSSYNGYEDYPYSPESAPTAVVTPRSDTSSVIAMAILAAAVMICAVIVVVAVMNNAPSDVASTPAQTTIITSTVAAEPEPSSPKVTTTPPPTRTATPPPAQDTVVPPPLPEPTSLQRLRAQAALDRGTARNAGSLWVPQLSSKRPGTVDDGIVWDYDDIWQEHLELRQYYGAILLWSADWAFNADDLWVTVATKGFPTADGARQWCLDHGRDTWHCFPTQLR